MSKRVFISKNTSEVTKLQHVLESKGHQLNAHSFLEFNQLEFDLKDNYDVIFFGSPRAVFFFKSQFEIPDSVQIACVGGKTATIIDAINRKVAFNGDEYGSISEVAKAFKTWCGNKKVLFPISTISLKTISSEFEDDQKMEVEVYKTTTKGKAIAPNDIYVFTSPSNVRGFLEMNSFPDNAKVIAWGDSTKNALEKLDIKVDIVLDNPSEEALILELESTL